MRPGLFSSQEPPHLKLAGFFFGRSNRTPLDSKGYRLAAWKKRLNRYAKARVQFPKIRCAGLNLTARGCDEQHGESVLETGGTHGLLLAMGVGGPWGGSYQ